MVPANIEVRPQRGFGTLSKHMLRQQGVDGSGSKMCDVSEDSKTFCNMICGIDKDSTMRAAECLASACIRFAAPSGSIARCIYLLVGWMVGWLAGWLVGLLVGWPAGRLAGRPAGWLVGLLAGWLAGWLAG